MLMTARISVGAFLQQWCVFLRVVFKSCWCSGVLTRVCCLDAILLAALVKGIVEGSIPSPQVFVPRPICQLVCGHIPGNLRGLQSHGNALQHVCQSSHSP